MSLCDYSSAQYSCPGDNPDISGMGVSNSTRRTFFTITDIEKVFMSSLVIGLAATISSFCQATLRVRIKRLLNHFMKDHRIADFNMEDPAVQLHISENPMIKRYVFWCDVLERIIIGIADQQIVTGYALLVTAYSRLPFPLSHRGRLQPVQFAFVTYLSGISGITQLSCMATLGTYLDNHPTLARIRIVLVIFFGVWLILSTGFLIASGQITYPSTYYLVCLCLLVNYTLTLFNLIPSRRERAIEESKQQSFIIRFSHALFNTSLSLISLAGVCLLAIQQKLRVPCDGEDACPRPLIIGDTWGFGQVLPMVMLLLLLFSGLEVYLESKDQERSATSTGLATAGPGSSVAGLASQTQVPQTTNDGGSSPASPGSGTGDQSHADLQSAPSDIEFHSMVSLESETQEYEPGSTVDNSHEIGQAQTASTCPPTASTTSGRQSDAENFGPPSRRRTAGQMV